jgi:two-component system OmpR family sensor kinase
MTTSTHRWRHLGTWTLRAKLVASMVLLFTLVAAATGAATVLSINTYLTSTNDVSLQTSLQRLTSGPDGRLPDNDNPRSGPGGPGDEGLVAVFSPTLASGRATGPSGGQVLLSEAQLTTLKSGSSSSRGTDVDLGDPLGHYRVMAASLNTGVTVVVGLPTAPQRQTIGTLTVVVAVGTLVGLVIVGLLGTYLVRRNLRPLRRVADTATRVAQLPLSSGEVDLSERVDTADTDTRTEVGQVGAALNGLLDHVDNALNSRHRSEQRVRQFVADASHELRTPLASIRGYAELSRREPEPVPEAVTHAMGRIESEASRMTSLVEDLLLLARLDSGRPLETTTVDLSQLVVDAVSDAHAAAPDHRFTLDLPEEPVEVVGDPGRLHQVVANLLGNARTHTPPGTTVSTGLAREDGLVRITVSDNGPGVPSSLQQHVFERFARGDTSRNRSGGSTGLGLSIVAAVVQAHGGRVELVTHPADPQQGRSGETTFAIVLPAAELPG